MAAMLSRWIHSTLVSLLGQLGLYSKTGTDFTAHNEQWNYSRAVLLVELQQDNAPSGATAGQSSLWSYSGAVLPKSSGTRTMRLHTAICTRDGGTEKKKQPYPWELTSH